MKMKLVFATIAVTVVAIFFSSYKKDAQTEPWNREQLMAPSVLAEKLENGKMENTFIFNIGPSGAIKNAISIGATHSKENMELLRKELAPLSQSAEVVIYCGCCPFEHCPNVRPAFELLKEMKFAHARLLNLPKNLKADWIDKGYPMQH